MHKINGHRPVDILYLLAAGERSTVQSLCAPIYPPYSSECVEEEFSEVRYTLVTISNGKDTTFGGCARTHDAATVPPNSGQRP
jgi:hypothetical protein